MKGLVHALSLSLKRRNLKSLIQKKQNREKSMKITDISLGTTNGTGATMAFSSLSKTSLEREFSMVAFTLSSTPLVQPSEPSSLNV